MKIIILSVLLSFAVCAQAGTITIASGTFSVTNPSAPITINEATATAVTFDVGLANDDSTAVTLTSVELYLSDNTNLAAAGAKVSTAITVTGAPSSVAGDDDGTSGQGRTNGMTANVQADATNCAAYNKLCIKVVPDDAVDCVDVTTNCVDDDTTPAPDASDAPDMTTQGDDESGSAHYWPSVSVMLILLLSTLLFRQG
ncbi:uncharacterized protein [Ptychodera flava]|uniref:uncharacterized protein n=1 Tax=Ptychodera flava TaxID=63121 RepID=UPI00396A381A